MITQESLIPESEWDGDTEKMMLDYLVAKPCVVL